MSERIFSGMAMYLGPDERPFGLTHGKKYQIEVDQLKSGRCRVVINDCDFAQFKATYSDKSEYGLYWKRMR